MVAGGCRGCYGFESAPLLPGILLCPGTHRRVVGSGRALRSDLRWWVTGDRRLIASRIDRQSVYIVSEWSGWVAASCMTATVVVEV